MSSSVPSAYECYACEGDGCGCERTVSNAHLDTVDSNAVLLSATSANAAEAHAMGIAFQGVIESAARGYNGLNTHVLLLTPSRAVWDLLLANAAHGHFDLLEIWVSNAISLGGVSSGTS